ncbi:MAG TPA: BON domain-containing protein [Gammaproteobacteria bacterium]|jgi:osmotically-inducible protein OsmY|nr:BON domain-containing protein [Gammaproteobacteria bacterium]
MKSFAKYIVIGSLALSLQGCFVVGAAAGAAAVALVYDHRAFENSLQDTDISNTIAAKIRRIPALRDESHINITVFNRIALLTGETPNPAWKQQAEEIAKSVPRVTRVYNQITIQGPSSSLIRTSDAWITAKIKSQMLATDDLKSSSIKVVTEDGVVYLMGIVKHNQADIAIDIARQVSGVQKVVKIFQYKN